jgi:hypothetical protein
MAKMTSKSPGKGRIGGGGGGKQADDSKTYYITHELVARSILMGNRVAT